MAFTRPLSFLYVAAVAFLLAACSSSNKPESTVQAFYAAAAKGDVDKATDLISLSNVPAAQMMVAKGKVQMLVGEMKNRIDSNGGLDEVTIVDTHVDDSGKTATVQAKVKYKNGKETPPETSHLVKEDGRWKLLLK